MILVDLTCFVCNMTMYRLSLYLYLTASLISSPHCLTICTSSVVCVTVGSLVSGFDDRIIHQGLKGQGAGSEDR